MTTAPRFKAAALIGAGPGDPELITVRGRALLAQADVVVHDREVDARVLALAAPGVELIDVGHAGPGALAEEAISYLIVEKAQEGKRVARLKWGDPFIFDRGGEEALFLREQGVDVEVVPGVPIAVAASAFAGIPVTYPGAGDTLTIIRGQDDTGTSMPDVDWTAIAGLNGTLLSYASAHQLPRMLQALAAHGCPPDMPAAVVRHGTLPSQSVEVSTVGALADSLAAQPRRDGGLLIVGRVVRFREHLRWFDARPLFGRTVLVTRPREQAAEFSERLTALGARVIELPLIEIHPPLDPRALELAAGSAGRFDWVVFTSANAVDAFMGALDALAQDARALGTARLCAVGPATAERLASYHLRVDLVPETFHAEGTFAALDAHGPLAGRRILLPQGDIARDVLAERLRAAGAEVTAVVAYRTVAREILREHDPDIYRMLLDGTLDCVTFTSGSAVRTFVRLIGEDAAVDLLKRTAVASIGPVTSDVARSLGIDVTVQPEQFTIPALTDAIAAHFSGASPAPSRG
ncbi:MAG: uroporphyrinogen-III C-methyltransferase [Vicinamibacterales bacterium]